MGEVVRFYAKDAAKSPDAVLEQAQGQYESVLVIGYDAGGHMDVRATLDLKASDILWLIESFKAKLVRGDYCDAEAEDL